MLRTTSDKQSLCQFTQNEKALLDTLNQILDTQILDTN
ncbi:hypothetical protein CLERM_139 [Coxiella-like endosymbiont]|nr:hypothetical protein CLERM_139 [Coxiella-like endosymbiont]